LFWVKGLSGFAAYQRVRPQKFHSSKNWKQSNRQPKKTGDKSQCGNGAMVAPRQRTNQKDQQHQNGAQWRNAGASMLRILTGWSPQDHAQISRWHENE
jgi:hypothetical protein